MTVKINNKTTRCVVKAVKQKIESTVMADETAVSSSCTRRLCLKTKPDVSLEELRKQIRGFSRTIFTRHQGNGELRHNIAGHEIDLGASVFISEISMPPRSHCTDKFNHSISDISYVEHWLKFWFLMHCIYAFTLQIKGEAKLSLMSPIVSHILSLLLSFAPRRWPSSPP